MAERHDAREKGYEDYHLNIGPVILSTAGIMAMAVLAFVAMWVMFVGLEQTKIYFAEDSPPMAAHQKPHDGPLIQVIPSAELSMVRAKTQKALTEYGWIDKDAGITHIPVERAIDLALQRGFPVRK